MKITKQYLRERMAEVNQYFGRPTTMFLDPTDPAGGSMAIGHLDLDHNYNGYQIEEIISCGGAVHNVTSRMSAREMNSYISGLLASIHLRINK